MPSEPGVPTRPRTLLRIVAWLLLAGIAFATLSPIGLRPITEAPPDVERALAFMAFGLTFALAYPRRLGFVIAIIVAAAIGLELLQLVAQTRHARIADAGFKVLGGGVGLALGVALNRAFSMTKAAPPA